MQTPAWLRPHVTSLQLLFAILVTGCSSPRVSYVTIPNRSAEAIKATTVQVFNAEGYRGGATTSGKMVFEKDASLATTVASEGVVNTAYGAQTVNRVLVEMFRLSDGAYRLQCSAVRVSGGDDPFFQQSNRIGSGPYKPLLEKVAEQVK